MRFVPAAAFACAFFGAAAPTLAHPHIFAEARLEVRVDGDGTVRSLRHVWRFDDAFSSTVLIEFDADKDLKLDASELDVVRQTVFESLADFDYFQFVEADGKDVAMAVPDPFVADFKDNQLLILFESTPKAPLKLAGTVEFGIYDPTFYTAIDYVDDSSMVVSALPRGCEQKMVRPDPDAALAQSQDSLTEDFFADPQNDDVGRLFATRLRVTCATESAG